MESLWLLPLLILFLFLSLGQVFKVYVTYNFLENLGHVVFKFFVFKVLKISFSLTTQEIIIKGKKKTKFITFESSDPNLKFFQNLSLQIKDKLRVKEINLVAKIGLFEAQQTALLCGALNVMFKTFSSYVKNIKPTASVYAGAYAFFKQKVLEVSFYGKMSLSVFDFLYVLLFSFFGQKNT